jgi:hypothetical protein
MFWQAQHPERSPQRSWRDRLRRAVDLAVAFATLEDDLAAATTTPPCHPDAPRSLHDHPHRQPLRGAQRPRRPGVVAARVQPCTTPLAPPAARRRTRARDGVRHGGR